MSVRVEYGTAVVDVDSAVNLFVDAERVENYKAEDLAAAVSAVVRAWDMDIEVFIDMLRKKEETRG